MGSLFASEFFCGKGGSAMNLCEAYCFPIALELNRDRGLPT